MYQTLYGVSQLDANTATAVGLAADYPRTGTIFRTADGGNTWSSQISGTSQFLTGVSFFDANTGMVVGESGTILRTNTGGK